MTIETLITLPQMERDEELQAFCYAEKYRNKLFEHNGKYIYFNLSSYEQMSKPFFDSLISIISTSFISQESIKKIVKEQEEESLNSYLELEEKLDNIDSKFSKLEENLNKLNYIESKFVKLEENIQSTQSTPNSNINSDEIIDRFNTIIEEFEERIDEKLNDKCSLEYVLELQKNVQLLSQKTTNNSNPLDIDSIKNILSEYDLINREDLYSVISNELQVVKDNLPYIISDQMKKTLPVQSTQIQTISKTIDPIDINLDSKKLMIHQLSSLKELGFTVEEIKYLRDNNLI